MNDPKEESSDMQDSSPDPTDPLPSPPWAEIESTKDKEPEGRQSLDDPPESRSPDPEEAPSPWQGYKRALRNSRDSARGAWSMQGCC